jgi:D-alanyl-D-alanine carboxypeptidase
MMFDRFARAARDVVLQAQEEARASGSRCIEAEHLLLALSDPPSPVAEVMAARGLDHDRLVEVLQREEALALESVGVPVDAYRALGAVRVEGKVRMGTSAKRALEVAVRKAAAHGAKRLEAAHLVLGILEPQHGTVARALRLSSTDVGELRRGVTATLA